MADSFYIQNNSILTQSAHANLDFLWDPWSSVNDVGDGVGRILAEFIHILCQ